MHCTPLPLHPPLMNTRPAKRTLGPTGYPVFCSAAVLQEVLSLCGSERYVYPGGLGTRNIIIVIIIIICIDYYG